MEGQAGVGQVDKMSMGVQEAEVALVEVEASIGVAEGVQEMDCFPFPFPFPFPSPCLCLCLVLFHTLAEEVQLPSEHKY